MDGTLQDTGWKPITVTGGDGQNRAGGVVQPVTRFESRPCGQCKSFEKQRKRLEQHFKAHGCTIEPDGTVTTPILKDFPDRKSLRLRLAVFGWCRLRTQPVDELASCQKWVPTSALAAVLGGHRGP